MNDNIVTAMNNLTKLTFHETLEGKHESSIYEQELYNTLSRMDEKELIYNTTNLYIVNVIRENNNLPLIDCREAKTLIDAENIGYPMEHFALIANHGDMRREIVNLNNDPSSSYILKKEQQRLDSPWSQIEVGLKNSGFFEINSYGRDMLEQFYNYFGTRNNNMHL